MSFDINNFTVLTEEEISKLSEVDYKIYIKKLQKYNKYKLIIEEEDTISNKEENDKKENNNEENNNEENNNEENNKQENNKQDNNKKNENVIQNNIILSWDKIDFCKLKENVIDTDDEKSTYTDIYISEYTEEDYCVSENNKEVIISSKFFYEQFNTLSNYTIIINKLNSGKKFDIVGILDILKTKGCFHRIKNTIGDNFSYSLGLYDKKVILRLTDCIFNLGKRNEKTGREEYKMYLNDNETDIDNKNTKINLLQHLKNISRCLLGGMEIAFDTSRGFLYLSDFSGNFRNVVEDIQKDDGSIEPVLVNPSRWLSKPFNGNILLTYTISRLKGSNTNFQIRLKPIVIKYISSNSTLKITNSTYWKKV